MANAPATPQAGTGGSTIVSSIAGPRDATANLGIILALVVSLAVVIPLDVSGPSWGQLAGDIWNALALLLVLVFAPDDRIEIVVCVLATTLGELLLSRVWGLYQYRQGNLPLFIPTGHGIAYAAALRLRRFVPERTGAVIVGIWLPYVTYAAVRGLDSEGVLWFAVFVACYAVGFERDLCATVFLMAWLIELYGTSLGSWRYFKQEPWFGLTTTNPSATVGGLYCLLVVVVRYVAGRLRRWRPETRA